MCRVVYVHDKQGCGLVKCINFLSILEDVSGGDGFGLSIIDNTSGKNEIKLQTEIGRIKQDTGVLNNLQDENMFYEQCLSMTRYSTIGKISSYNQQPIPIKDETDRIIAVLVHNGTLYPHRYTEIGHERPEFSEGFIKDKMLWKEQEHESDTRKMVKTLSEYVNNPEAYFREAHPYDQTVMLLYEDGTVYAHRGHNPLRYFMNSKFLVVNNQWGKDLARGTYTINKSLIKRVRGGKGE